MDNKGQEKTMKVLIACEFSKCPYPIQGDNGTARECILRGHCACDEREDR